MLTTVKLIITHVPQDRGARAVRADNGESVYLPHALTRNMAVQAYEELEAIIGPNDHPAAQWLVMKARRTAAVQ